MKKLTYKQLEQKLVESLASSPTRYTIAHGALKNIHTDKLMGSGVLITIQGIGGKQIIDPILICDGLSSETIEAIRNDIKRSYDFAVMYKI